MAACLWGLRQATSVIGLEGDVDVLIPGSNSRNLFDAKPQIVHRNWSHLESDCVISKIRRSTSIEVPLDRDITCSSTDGPQAMPLYGLAES